MATDTQQDIRHKSRVVVDGPDRAPARSMLRAVGLKDEDFDKPFVALANLASDVTPCNVHLDRLAAKVKQGLWDEMIVYMAPRLMGETAKPLAALGFNTMGETVSATVKSVETLGPDIRIIYTP